MRCCWCGGEIIYPIQYEAPENMSEIIEKIKSEMREKTYCTPSCMAKYLRSITSDITETIA